MRRPAILAAPVAVALLAGALTACGGGDDVVERRIPAPGTMVFTQGVDLWIQDEDGARLLIAAEQDQQLLHPAISPDGQRVAYVVFQLTQADGATIGTDLAVAALDGSRQEIVVEHSRAAEFVWMPRWTPDGESLIFTHEAGELSARVLRFDLRRREIAILREDARDADISPDGSRLVFISGPYSGDPHLVIRDLSDGSEVELDPERAWEPRPYRIPQFSADGAAVIFSAGQVLPQVSVRAVAANGPEDIWILDLAGGELTQLAAIGEDEPDFAISADGRHVLILGTFGVYLAALSPGESPFAIAPGEFHGSFDWIGSVDEAEWEAIRASVYELPDASP